MDLVELKRIARDGPLDLVENLVNCGDDFLPNNLDDLTNMVVDTVN